MAALKGFWTGLITPIDPIYTNVSPFFDILVNFKHLTLKGQSCCSCSYMVLLNKLKVGWVNLALSESCGDAVFIATGISPAKAQTEEDQ